MVSEKTLESPLDCKEIQPVLKETSPERSLEGLMLKLKLLYFGHPMWRADSLEKTLMLGKIEDRRRWGWQRMRWLDGITGSMDMSLGKLWGVGNGQGGLVCCSPWVHKESDTTERLIWTEMNWNFDPGERSRGWLTGIPTKELNIHYLKTNRLHVRNSRRVHRVHQRYSVAR